MLTPATVHALLDEHGLHPKRSLGQNFLADPNTARRVVALGGAGAGDPGARDRSRPRLAHARAARRRARRRRARARRPARPGAAGSDLVRRRTGGAGAGPRRDRRRVPRRPRRPARRGPAAPWACVSNLPYNVAVPVVVRLLEEVPPVERILVMVQREVGERLAAGPGDEQYGAVSVKVAYFAEAKVVGLVPPTVFVPRPKVDSALVRLDRRAAPPVAVPSADDLFALVRAGFAQRRKMLRRSLVPDARRPHARGARRRRASSPPPGAEALGLDSGPRWPAARRRPHETGTGPGHGVPEAQPVAAGARVVAPTASTTSSRWSSRSASRTTCSRRSRCRHRAACRWRCVRVEVGDDVPTDHRNLAFIAAEKLMVRAGRSGHGVRLVLRKHIPAGGGLGGGSADAAAALLAVPRAARRRHRRRGRARARGRGRVRRAVLRPRRRGVDARARRDHRAGVAADAGSRSSWRSRRSGCRPRRLRGVGQARRPAVRPRRCPRRDALAPACPRARERPRAGGRGARAAAASSSAPRSRPPTGRARAAGGQRLGLRGARRRRAAAARRWSTQVSRRLRVPVVGTTSVSRGVRLASSTARFRRRADAACTAFGARKAGLAALLAALPARLLQKLLVLLLPHALAALLDQ